MLFFLLISLNFIFYPFKGSAVSLLTCDPQKLWSLYSRIAYLVNRYFGERSSDVDLCLLLVYNNRYDSGF